MAAEEEIERWRHAAAHARREAGQSRDPSLEQHWLEIADSYEALLREARVPAG